MLNTAIERYRAIGPVEVNKTAVYATYTSGMFNDFYSTEAGAIAHCVDPSNGCEFNGAWIQDSYSTYLPGELFTVPGNEAVYASGDCSRSVEPVMARWQIPFVEWSAEAPLAV